MRTLFWKQLSPDCFHPYLVRHSCRSTVGYFEASQFDFGNRELCESTIQTDQHLWEQQHRWNIYTVPTWKVHVNLRTVHLLIFGSALPTGHATSSTSQEFPNLFFRYANVCDDYAIA